VVILDRYLEGLAWRESEPLEAGAPTLLFLHGLGGSRTAWEAQLKELGQQFRCVAWDMPGYGASLPIESLTFERIAIAAAHLLDLIEVTKAHVVGLSFGGQQALHLALRHPERVRSLVLADTSAVFGADGTDPEVWKELRLGPLDAGLTPAEIAEAVIDAITAPGFGGLERDRAISAFKRIQPDGLRAAVHCLPSHDLRPHLHKIKAATLVVVGELDEETPLPYSRFLADNLPNASLEVIEGAGHLTPSEAPTTFNNLVTKHLNA